MGAIDERKYLLHRGSAMVAEYYEKKIIDNFLSGYVAIQVKNLGDMLYFMPCDENGFPHHTYFKTMDMIGVMPYLEEKVTPPFSELTFVEYTIVAKSPLVFYSLNEYDYSSRNNLVFLWEGEIINKNKVKLEELEVKHLMKLAQEAIKKREGLITEIVQKNRLIQ